MSSHTLALGLSAFAYIAARRLAQDGRFAFGTWKIEILGGYTSALLLLLVAGAMVYGSVERLLVPTPIDYDPAILVAAVGLVVNLACAWLLRGHHHHDHHAHAPQHHDHSHGHNHHHHHHQDDLNLRSAYLHVLADAVTSVLAILALFGGKLFQADWLDPVMGLIGAGLVAVWAFSLLRDTSKVLLDAEMDSPVVRDIRATLAASPEPVQIIDLHVWRVALSKYACILALKASASCRPDDVKQQLATHSQLAHITIEINPD